MKKIPQQEFWVTNISTNKDVALGDLRLTIRKGESRNLLDSKHYTYTHDQLVKSSETGSIFIKSKFIKVRSVAPVQPLPAGKYTTKDGRFLKPLRSQVKLVEKKFEELDIVMKQSQEAQAAEDADISAEEHAPTLAVDKMYKDIPKRRDDLTGFSSDIDDEAD